MIGPHHDVGASPDLEVREMEYRHHGDALVPRQQRFAAYCQSLLKAWGFRSRTATDCVPRRVRARTRSPL